MSRRIGNWTVGERIGSGGQGRVYKVTGDEGDEVRAIKLIEPRDNESPLPVKKRARFVREVTHHIALSDADAPNIISVLDHNLVQFREGMTDTGFTVMPLAKGTLDDFKSILTGRVELCLEVFLGILNGVGQAHELDVIHRDLKPANILFLDESLRVPLVTDFGICFVKDEERLTKTDETVGNLYFMAPEQEAGRLDEVDVRVDIYALGKLLHFMLTGRYLSRERLEGAFYDEERRADGRINRIEKEILARTIVEKPDDRFPSTRDLKQAVEEILGEGGGGASIPPTSPVPTTGGQGSPESPTEVTDALAEPAKGSLERSYDTAGQMLASSDYANLRLWLDESAKGFRAAWKQLRPEYEQSPQMAPDAAAKMASQISQHLGVALAFARLNSVELFDDFKRMIESMLRVSEHEDGYVAVSSVPHAATGFLYMAASVAALHWNSWSLLNRLLNDKFEWYFMSGRPLFSFGFNMEYFFHVEAFERHASAIHDFYQQVLSQPEYLRILNLDQDSFLTIYVQTQMVQSLRAAQEVEKGSSRAMWPDFGRYHEYRVERLLDRVWADAQFAENFCALFDEAPETWKKSLNQRLKLIRENWFTGGSFIWDSVEIYEPR